MTKVLTKRADRFSETTIDDEVVVMNLDSGDFFSLVDSARAIWELIDGKRDHATIISILSERFGTPADEIGGEVDRFIAELEAAGLVGRG